MKNRSKITMKAAEAVVRPENGGDGRRRWPEAIACKQAHADMPGPVAAQSFTNFRTPHSVQGHAGGQLIASINHL
jgi:hypothetical protein